VIAVTGNVRLQLKNKSNDATKKAKRWYIGKYGKEWEGLPGDLLKLKFNEDTTPTKAGQKSWRDNMIEQKYTEDMIYELGNLAAAITVPNHVIESKSITEPEKEKKKAEQFEQWRREVGDTAERLISLVTDRVNTTVEETVRHIAETESLSGYHAEESDEWNIVDTLSSGSTVITGAEVEMLNAATTQHYNIDDYDDDEWTDCGYNGSCIMNHLMTMITTADYKNLTGSGRFQCKMCMQTINPEIDGEQFLMVCFVGNCAGKYTMCKDCSCINNQERRMHTVQGILQTHAQAATLRDDNNPTLAANAMLTVGQVANLAMIIYEDELPTKSRAIACASTRSPVTDVHSGSSQGAAMVTDIGSP